VDVFEVQALLVVLSQHVTPGVERPLQTRYVVVKTLLLVGLGLLPHPHLPVLQLRLSYQGVLFQLVSVQL
jgi:hypothetical protein